MDGRAKAGNSAYICSCENIRPPLLTRPVLWSPPRQPQELTDFTKSTKRYLPPPLEPPDIMIGERAGRRKPLNVGSTPILLTFKEQVRHCNRSAYNRTEANRPQRSTDEPPTETRSLHFDRSLWITYRPAVRRDSKGALELLDGPQNARSIGGGVQRLVVADDLAAAEARRGSMWTYGGPQLI